MHEDEDEDNGDEEGWGVCRNVSARYQHLGRLGVVLLTLRCQPRNHPVEGLDQGCIGKRGITGQSFLLVTLGNAH